MLHGQCAETINTRDDYDSGSATDTSKCGRGNRAVLVPDGPAGLPAEVGRNCCIFSYDSGYLSALSRSRGSGGDRSIGQRASTNVGQVPAHQMAAHAQNRYSQTALAASP